MGLERELLPGAERCTAFLASTKELRSEFIYLVSFRTVRTRLYTWELKEGHGVENCQSVELDSLSWQ